MNAHGYIFRMPNILSTIVHIVRIVLLGYDEIPTEKSGRPSSLYGKHDPLFDGTQIEINCR